MNAPQRIRLGDLLTQEGLIRPEQLTEALSLQKATGRKLGRIFVDNGWVTEAQIAKTVARQLRVPYQDLSDTVVRPDAVRALPEGLARRMRAMVLESDALGARVAMGDPTDIAAFDEIARLLKKDVQLVAVSESQLLALIDRSYTLGEDIGSLAKELTSELGAVEDELGELLGLNTAGAEDAPVVRLLQSVFEEALRKRASDIHIEPQERSLRIRFRIDGVLQVQTEADAKISTAVALRLKLMSGLDISERRLPQDGRFHVKLRNSSVDVRISTMPTQHGESVVMRLLNQSTGLLHLDGLSLPRHVKEAIGRAIERPSGMFLVTGPTGSGKTTTLYATLNALNNTERKIITVEDPVEYRLPGLNQVQVHEKIDLSFERVLRAALRQDPDVVLVGEMRDQVTAEVGLRAAMTGHLVLSTLHTNDAVSTPIRLLDMGVPRYMVALSLHLVLAQRLVRTICTHCAQAHEPTPQEHAWFEANGESLVGATLKRGRGCVHCSDTGYSGRTGVYEFLEMDQGLITALNRGDNEEFTRLGRAQMKGNNLRHDALRLVKDGRTTLEEALRVSTAVDEL
ncbi:GspE/PulE family protein [Inhella gelatinilytica]|uniref:Flp pilus assembly complex ATPase component TadA n=1 Tax=Inhella gelatinilytica TaxID=2795030 RepID=A0A931IRH0_9BURK|nr:GspE/PulE family protein [Inhella gelatinilytica]MBH9551332.1 Flp pilus assembly complex ATPase component TadA [Inhella gelatinilytica]